MSEAENEVEFSIQKIYVKDVSFESPNSPQVFREQWEPQVDVDLQVQNQDLGEQHHEVVLTVTVNVKNGDKPAFLVEVKQAGIFGLVNFAEDQLGGVLGSFCPNILFPYVREVISETAVKGGFPPLYLSPVNFDAMYESHLQQQEETAATH